MGDRPLTPPASVGPANLVLAGLVDGRVAHLVGVVPGYPVTSAVCGSGVVWTQAELDAATTVPLVDGGVLVLTPRLSARPRCGLPGCAGLWRHYDAIPRPGRAG